jgi:hypothetical protein
MPWGICVTARVTFPDVPKSLQIPFFWVSRGDGSGRWRVAKWHFGDSQCVGTVGVKNRIVTGRVTIQPGVRCSPVRPGAQGQRHLGFKSIGPPAALDLHQRSESSRPAASGAVAQCVAPSPRGSEK